MKLAVHQPQYIPWLGYFHKIANCDLFIFLDDVQYKKREFQNRNKIKAANGPQWLTVPVLTKGAFDQTIMETQTDPTENWTQTHWKAIEHNYHKAPFFNEHAAFFSALYKEKWGRLMDVSMEIIKYALKYLQIETPWKMASPYSLSSTSTQRIIDLCKAESCDTYLSGSGGKSYMDEGLFEKNGIALLYQHYDHPTYQQLYGNFMPYLSIVDLFFNCGPRSRDIVLCK
jgi:hypothetical protein